ncbi:NAD(P)-binding protein [Leucogyrophana mollusca]|uniref:NAD(P)-binding protein n=1 Tax=Leucogyrophana mollusca TaxID=85980 RepID=A0ACB8B989_9AGAM|nr:NAD(P)-binding protein [Leucogyrophana mollusca]
MPSINDSKCILIVGSTAGIGRSLALSILALPSKPTVIVCGRRKERLDELVAAHGGDGRLKAVQLDVTIDRTSLKASIDDIIEQFPELDAVMFSSGIQHISDFSEPETINLDDVISELTVNYISIVSMITFFLPHLIKIGETRPSFIYTISSNLGIAPVPGAPNYCATKAALHSLSLSLNVQLKNQNVHVVEIIPPLVESELHELHHAGQGGAEAYSGIWMPLEQFTKATMVCLERGDVQIPVGRAARRYAKYESGKLEGILRMQAFQRKAAEGN